MWVAWAPGGLAAAFQAAAIWFLAAVGAVVVGSFRGRLWLAIPRWTALVKGSVDDEALSVMWWRGRLIWSE